MRPRCSAGEELEWLRRAHPPKSLAARAIPRCSQFVINLRSLGIDTVLALQECLLITAHCVLAPGYRHAKHITDLPNPPAGVVSRLSTRFRRAPGAGRRTKAPEGLSRHLGCRPEQKQGVRERQLGTTSLWCRPGSFESHEARKNLAPRGCGQVPAGGV